MKMMSAEEINKAGWTYACERGTQGRMLLDQAKAAIELREALERVHRSIDYSTCNIGVGVIGDLLSRYEA